MTWSSKQVDESDSIDGSDRLAGDAALRAQHRVLREPKGLRRGLEESPRGTRGLKD